MSNGRKAIIVGVILGLGTPAVSESFACECEHTPPPTKPLCNNKYHVLDYIIAIVQVMYIIIGLI